MATVDWNIRETKAREAAKQLPGWPNIDWGDVLVAHLDTGYTDHGVFQLGPGGSDSWFQPSRGLNLIDPGVTDPRDPLKYPSNLLSFPGHGTRTGGLLTGGLPGAFMGVMPALPTVPYRVTNSVIIHAPKALGAAIRHAVDVNGADVISISLGAPSPSQHIGAALDYAYERGVIVVCAAGQEFGSVTYPGAHSRCICVGGMNEKGNIWFDYEINRHLVDIWAPADDVMRPNSKLNPDGSVSDAAVGEGDGTSFATVHVAAAAAAWLLHRRAELMKAKWQGWRRVEAFRKLLWTTGTKLSGSDAAGASSKPYVAPKRNLRLDMLAVLDTPIPAVKDNDIQDIAANDII